MQQPANGAKYGAKKHKKLLLAVGLLAVLVGGYFVYRFAYIYTERRKYDQTAVAITRVADDLRAAGIVTEFSKGCGRTQEVYGDGSLSCDINITHNTRSNSQQDKATIALFVAKLSKEGFSIQKDEIGTSGETLNTGTSSYSLQKSELPCGLTYDNNEDSMSQFSFGCGKSSSFRLF